MVTKHFTIPLPCFEMYIKYSWTCRLKADSEEYRCRGMRKWGRRDLEQRIRVGLWLFCGEVEEEGPQQIILNRTFLENNAG